MAAKIAIYDTTLRDGTQGEGMSLSVRDKVRIAKRLDAFGISYVEGGWPGSNPKDEAFFARAMNESWQHTTLCAFGATRRAGCTVEEDPNIIALISSGAPLCTVFGKSSTLQVEDVLRTQLDTNLRMVRETVEYLCAAGRRVFFDAEHFFDGFSQDAAYALAVITNAAQAGAECVVLCDTNGGTMPWQVQDSVEVVRKALDDAGCEATMIGIHAHDDSGLAVANSLAAVRAGATQVQGTINGYGERCGNANLCAIIPNLELKMGLRTDCHAQLSELSRLSRFVAEIANISPDDQMPYVGRSAFAHKGGVHVSAMRRTSASYQHIEPEQVGNRCRILVSELSGRANVLSKAEEAGLSIRGQAAADVLEAIKDAESRGYSFEAAEASVELMVRRTEADYEPPFELVDYKVLVGAVDANQADVPNQSYAEAMVKVRIHGELIHTAAEGDGPVEALDGALRKALIDHYPKLEEIELTDYKVRILDGRDGTAAITRVLIDSRSGKRRWSTVGASTNIIEASCIALLDSIEHGLAFADRSSLTPPLLDSSNLQTTEANSAEPS